MFTIAPEVREFCLLVGLVRGWPVSPKVFTGFAATVAAYAVEHREQTGALPHPRLLPVIAQTDPLLSEPDRKAVVELANRIVAEVETVMTKAPSPRRRRD